MLTSATEEEARQLALSEEIEAETREKGPNFISDLKMLYVKHGRGTDPHGKFPSWTYVMLFRLMANTNDVHRAVVPENPLRFILAEILHMIRPVVYGM